jgi:hypothetical protein
MLSMLAIVAVAAPVVASSTLSSRECVAVRVLQSDEERQRVVSRERGQRRMPPTVSAASTLDLRLQVEVRPVLKGDHLLRLDLFTPRGYLYQTMTLPFRFVSRAEEKAARGSQVTRSVAGFPRPLEVQLLTKPARRRRQANHVTARLPVAGTSIALGSLFGQWKAVPYLDDRAAPCGPAASFVIAE